MPGIFSRDTLFSYGNHEPGWVTAPGMQGVDVQPFTANMLTPESLSELMGGPDAAILQAPAAFGPPPGGNLPGPPDSYSENNPLPPLWYGRLACRSVALAMVGTVLTACGSWRGGRPSSGTVSCPLTPWGALVQARATLLTSWSASAC